MRTTVTLLLFAIALFFSALPALGQCADEMWDGTKWVKCAPQITPTPEVRAASYPAPAVTPQGNRQAESRIEASRTQALPPPAPVFTTWEEAAAFLRGKRIWISTPRASDQLKVAINSWYARWAQYGGGYFGFGLGYGGYGHQPGGTYSDFDPFLSMGSHLKNFLGIRLQQWRLNTTEDPKGAEYLLHGDFVTMDEQSSGKSITIPLIISIDKGKEKFAMNLFLRIVDARTGDVVFRPTLPSPEEGKPETLATGLGKVEAQKYRELYTLFYSSRMRRETNAGPLAEQMVLAVFPRPPAPTADEQSLATRSAQVSALEAEARNWEARAELAAREARARRKIEDAKKDVLSQ
ncbi:MAG: hypothetical protein Q8R08_02690 [bacterium]|nr:hypothetical protein [bacterium]